MRDNRIDNIKGLLIFLVVFGHVLEFCDAGGNGFIIRLIIYSFHMPSFFFFMGMVAKPNHKRVIRNVAIYAVFQITYIFFNAIVLKESISLQFTEPYWILWFIVLCVYYDLLLIVVDKLNVNKKLLFAVSLIVSLAVGYVQQIGYEFSLSRAFTFFPYYVAGMLFAHSEHKNERNIIVAIITGILVLIPVFFNYYSILVLFGSYSYADAGYNPVIKGSLYLVGFIYILFLYMYCPDRELPIINEIGKNTLPIYLLHGFFMRVFRAHNCFKFSPNINLLLAIILSAMITIALSKVKILKRKAT